MNFIGYEEIGMKFFFFNKNLNVDIFNTIFQ